MATKRFLRKILVPIDGSGPSLMAEETATVIAKKVKASVTVLNVTQELSLAYGLPHNLEEEILARVEQEADKIMNDASALFREEKVPADTMRISKRDPADSILELSKDYDLVVIGAHGENEKDLYALGSVTKKVMEHAIRPTLIVKKVSPISNLLVSIDGSDHSIKALEYAINLSEKMGSKITLLNVQEKRIHDLSPITAKTMGERVLSKALNAAGKKRLKIDKRLEFGVASDKIVEVAEEENHDLIVVGSRGLGVVDRFLLGSVSDDVSHKAKCSVLIVQAKS